MNSAANYQGIVVSAYGGFYQVRVNDSGQELTCKARGRLKKSFQAIYPGDRVTVSAGGADTPMIEQIEPRLNRLPRPRIVNLQQALLVMAVAEPAYDVTLLDKMLVTCHINNVQPLICFNKLDLLQPAGRPQFDAAVDSYRKAGLTVYTLSALYGDELSLLLPHFAHKLTVLAGPSGVGKSSLLNRLLPGHNAQVGAISQRLNLGKHTTRQVSILPIGSGLIADTPGFALLDLPPELTAEQLAAHYPDFAAFAVACRFEGCQHHREPDCAVKRAVEQGEISERRYAGYLRLHEELRQRRKNR
ncbi:MAG: ribosome small subunit-dependent GTPase A [Bacillota bacterium]|nr:ribosome small subunit-dependent GTPase A [Bacillota bacterium]